MHSSTIGWLPITEDGASVKTLKLVGNGSTFPLLQAIRINGKVLVDSSLVTDAVKIVSIDADNNQMVVDGGEWDASNKDEVWSNGTLVGNRNDTSVLSIYLTEICPPKLFQRILMMLFGYLHRCQP